MGMLEDLIKMLDRVPQWKRLGKIPEEVDYLSRRVAALEEKLNGKWPPDVCRYCGERAARLHFAPSGHDKGYKREEWKCERCERIEVRTVKIT